MSSFENSDEIIVTPEGITVYPPTEAGKPWRAVWYDPDGTRRSCRAMSESAMAAKLDPVKARLATESTRTQRPGSELVAHYLDPGRMPADKPWSRQYRMRQEARCKVVLEVIGDLPCEKIKIVHMQKILNSQPTVVTGKLMYFTLSGIVKAGIAAGYLTNPRLAMIHWEAGGRKVSTPKVQRAGESNSFVDPRNLPTHEDVARLAEATQRRSTARWWHELFIYTAAYTGMRSGELRALRADNIDFQTRLIEVLEQVIEVDGKQFVEPPKERKWRTTIFPEETPSGYALSERLLQRAGEARRERELGTNPLALIFPARAGGHLHYASFHVSVLGPAYKAAGWRENLAPGQRGTWTLHTLRHVFCTTAINDWGISVTDVSQLAGHANTRITMEKYVSSTAGGLNRAFEKTRKPKQEEQEPEVQPEPDPTETDESDEG